MNILETVDAESLLYNPIRKTDFIIEDILPVGLHLFCGASKIGKSWLMLKICLQVSKGEPIWNLQTKKGEVLYLCLEDTLARIQSRLFKVTDEANDKLRFCISTNNLSTGLIKQLENFIKMHSDTKLIVIDTLQKIRNQSNDNSYASDYGDISILKSFADKYNLAIVVVHHIRKQGDSDIFNKVSGTNGIMGSSDSTFILERKSRTESTATLYITGRDVEYQEFILKFNKCNWELISKSTQEEIEEKHTPDVIYKIISFLEEKSEWKGSATELLKELEEKEVAPTVITKILNEYHYTKLKENHITYDVTRTKNGRLIILRKNIIGDIDDNNDNDIEIPILSSDNI